MSNQHNSKRIRSSLSLDELKVMQHHELEKTIYQTGRSSISDMEIVWQRRDKSQKLLGEPCIKQLLKVDQLSDEKMKILHSFLEKRAREVSAVEAQTQESQITNIIKFIETYLPSHSATTHFLKGNNKYMRALSEDNLQLFWNPCTAHHETKKRIMCVLPTLKHLYESCGVEAYKEKLQEMIILYYKIFNTNDVDLYLSVFENTPFYDAIIKLLDILQQLEKTTKKKESTTSDKKDEGASHQATKTKQLLIAPAKRKVTKILISDEASYLNILPYEKSGEGEPLKFILQLEKWKIKKWCKHYLHHLNTQLVQLQNEKQTLKCRLCDSKIDITEAKQHSDICLKNSQTKKQILVLDQDLVHLINESVKLRNQYRKDMNLLIVKQNKQFKNAYKEDTNGFDKFEDPSPVNNSSKMISSGRILRPMMSLNYSDAQNLEENNNPQQSNPSLQQIDEDSQSSSSQSRIGGSGSPVVRIERKDRRRIGTQIHVERVPSITQLPRKVIEINEKKMEEYKNYGDVLKQLITFGEKVINANEQTLDIRNEIDLRREIEQFKSTSPAEVDEVINVLIEKFDKHLQERIEITKKAQKYDQDLRDTSASNNPVSSNAQQAKNKGMLQGISGSMKVKNFKFGQTTLTKPKSGFGAIAASVTNEENKTENNPSTQEQESTDQIASPKPDAAGGEVKKEEPKKKMVGSFGNLKAKLGEKNKAKPASTDQQSDQQLSTSGSMSVSASMDSVQTTLSTSESINIPQSSINNNNVPEPVSRTVSAPAPTQESQTNGTNSPAAETAPKQEAPKKMMGANMFSKLKQNLNIKNISKAEGVSNSLDRPNTNIAKPPPPQPVHEVSKPEQAKEAVSTDTKNEKKEETITVTMQPPKLSSEEKQEKDKQSSSVPPLIMETEEIESPLSPPKPKDSSPKKRILRRNASNIIEADEESEDDDDSSESSSSINKSQTKKSREVVEIIEEDENEHVDSPNILATKDKEEKRVIRQIKPEDRRQSAFAKVLGSTPMPPRKLDQAASSLEKLNQFKNFQSLKRKSDGDSPQPTSKETLLNSIKDLQEQKKEDKKEEQKVEDLGDIDMNDPLSQLALKIMKNNESLEDIPSENTFDQNSEIIQEEEESDTSNSSVRFSESTIGKVSETNLPSDSQLAIMNLISFSNTNSKDMNDSSLQLTTQSPPNEKANESKNRMIKLSLQNLEQITPKPDAIESPTKKPLVSPQKLLMLQQAAVEDKKNTPQQENEASNQINLCKDTKDQDHLSTQEDSPTDKANEGDKIDPQIKSRFFKESKSLKDEESSTENRDSSSPIDIDNLLGEDNLIPSSNVITAPSDSQCSTNRGKKKQRNDLDNARFEDTENLIDSDESSVDEDKKEGDEQNNKKNLKYFSSSSSSDSEDSEADQMIASLLNDSALSSNSDSDDSDKPAFMKIIKDKEQVKPECQKSRFSFITPLLGSEDSAEDNGYESKNKNEQIKPQTHPSAPEKEEEKEEEQQLIVQKADRTEIEVCEKKKFNNLPSVYTYYPDMTDFSEYNIITEKGFNSDSEFVKLDTQKKKDQMSVGFKDFEFLKMLGKGAYGGVYLVKKKNTNDLFAMKIIDCSGKLDKKYLETLQSEKNVFEVITGDWVVKAFYSFVHENYLCFVLEYMMGGDFNSILSLYTALDQWIVEIYLAELVLAIEYLHSMDIVHRDLKPDNMLIDTTGHLKLADFGLSEVGFKSKLNKHINKTDEDGETEGGADLTGININEGKEDNDFKIEIQVEGMINNEKEQNKRIVGTPDYIAPEIITGESTNNKSLDWWSMGVIMYEFLVGLPPFNADTVEEIFDNISNLRMEWPEVGDINDGDKISPEAYDLIKRLLNPNYKERLGARGVKEIKEHKFFQNIKWNKLRSNRPPIQPKGKQAQEAKEKREKDKEQMQQFVNSLNIKQGIRKTDDVSKKLQEELKVLERPDLVAQQNIQEAEQMIEEKGYKIQRLQKKIDQFKQNQTKLETALSDFNPVKALDDFQT